MAELWFDAEADSVLADLEIDKSRVRLCERVQAVLRQLELDPGDSSLRRHRFQDPPVFCVTATGNGEVWAILWRLHPERPDIAQVVYIGPASFA